MSEIFLYTPQARLESAQLEALRRKGYIPVKVENMEAVKIVPAPIGIPQATLDVVLQAACQTFSEYAHDSSVNARFGRHLASLMLKASQEQAS